MNPTIDDLLEQALKLKPAERAKMAERLLTSLDTETDLETELAWQKEVQKRVQEIDDGQIVCLPWEEVRNRLRGNQRHAH